MTTKLNDNFDGEELPVRMSDALVQELDRRKEAAEQDPSRLVPWEVVRERMGISSVAASDQQA
jgi:putative addiction module component (TIGR02574 family)